MRGDPAWTAHTSKGFPMKTLTIISAAALSLAAMGASANAQNKPIVPGSEATSTAVQNQSRENVRQEQPSTMDSAPVESSETIVPGSDSDIDLQEAETRNDVAAGTDAMGTTAGGDGSVATSNGSMDNAENPSAEANSTETASPMEMQKAN